MIYKSGDKYEGGWLADVRHGLGTLWVYKDGKYKVRYNGEWRDDQPTVRRWACLPWGCAESSWVCAGPAVRSVHIKLWACADEAVGLCELS